MEKMDTLNMIKYSKINYKILKLYNIIIIFKFIRGYYRGIFSLFV